MDFASDEVRVDDDAPRQPNPTREEILAKAAEIRAATSPQKALTRQRKAGVPDLPDRLPAILVRLASREQRETIHRKAMAAGMSLNAYCLQRLLGSTE